MIWEKLLKGNSYLDNLGKNYMIPKIKEKTWCHKCPGGKRATFKGNISETRRN